MKDVERTDDHIFFWPPHTVIMCKSWYSFHKHFTNWCLIHSDFHVQFFDMDFWPLCVLPCRRLIEKSTGNDLLKVAKNRLFSAPLLMRHVLLGYCSICEASWKRNLRRDRSSSTTTVIPWWLASMRCNHRHPLTHLKTRGQEILVLPHKRICSGQSWTIVSSVFGFWVEEMEEPLVRCRSTIEGSS